MQLSKMTLRIKLSKCWLQMDMAAATMHNKTRVQHLFGMLWPLKRKYSMTPAWKGR